MKRFFLSGVLGLAMAHAAFAQQQSFTWSGTHIFQVPNDPPPTIDAYNFAITPGATFGVDMSLEQFFFETSIYFSTSDTLNITNRGKLVGIPGFDFAYHPNPPPQPRPGVPFSDLAGTFANIGNGLGGGSIYCTNIYGGFSPFNTLNPFNVFFGFVFGSGSTGVLPESIPGLAEVRIRATNVIDSGLISMDNTGLIDIKGGDVDLQHGQFVMTNSPLFGSSADITPLDWGSGLFGDTNLIGWDPSVQLTATTATTPFFLSSVYGFFERMVLTNATVYMQATPVGANLIIWDGVYLQDSSASNVVKNVYITPDTTSFGFDEFNIEWGAPYRDPLSAGTKTNYFYLFDAPTLRRNTNAFFANPPNEFSFFESQTQLTFFTPPATPGYFNPAPPGILTNDFSYISVHPNAALVDTNVVFGGSVTNLPGRIQISASHSLNLANTHISGPNYLSLTSTNDFLGNGNALIASPYTDLNLGARSGFLAISNLLQSDLIQWTGVPGAPSAVSFQPMGGVQAWSGSYIFVDANGVTNDVRMLLVNSALQPTTPALQQNVILHAANTLTVSDSLTIFHSFFSDATTLIVTTNANSAFALAGEINFTSPDIFWSTAMPNLQFLTNSGLITTANQAIFAGNLINPYSNPDSATPYQSFVNYGDITNQGTFIRTGWFQNNGAISENNGGSIDIKAATAIATNGTFVAPLGNVSVVANSLLASNGVIQAGGTLAFSTPCFLSDGYAFENQFGHITNSVLPYVVTNGNIWTVNGGIQIGVKPATGDLLGTTITNFTAGGLNAGILWPGEDRGITPGGYATNIALGRLILNADANSASEFTFQTQNGNNAIYIDSLELQGNTTNTDVHGNPQSIAIQSGMTVYYAQATENGVSIAEKLNGKYGAASAGLYYTNGGRFFWVSNYAGVYSSTNIPYPDGNTYIFNEALAISPDIDSDGDGTVNGSDATPISIGTVYDISNIGPISCDGGIDGGITGYGGQGGGGTGPTNGASSAPGTLSFPNPSSGSSSISFALAQGSYNGLFYDTNGVNPASSGFFTAKVTAKRGLSAKLQLGGHTYSFSKPPFDNSGHFSGQVSSKGAAALNVDLQLVNNDEIVGQVSGNGWTAKLVAERAAFGPKNKAPWAGSDTLLLSTKTNSTTAAGDSFASVSISSSGAVQLSGMLPDGTKISQKSALSKDGLWPLYAAPYGGAGAFIGWMQCTNNPDITGSGVWVVPAGANALYPGGLTNDLDATGSSTTGSVNSSVKAILNGPSLDSTLTNRVTIIGKIGQNADGSLKLSVNPKTGLFSGSLADPNGGEVLSLQGAFLESSESSGGGFFLSSDKKQGGKITLVPAN